MTAETMAKALGGRKVGQGWTARCPAHDDREPSLSIRDADGKVLVRCHAGCDQRDVIAALKERGLWGGKAHTSLQTSRHRKVSPPRPDLNQVERSAAALSIWQSTIPAEGTPVEAYLASRGLTCSLPPSLRRRQATGHPPDISRPRGPSEGAGRTCENDARPVPRWCGSPRPTR
jgi:putative DNA primase/helicase